jgi:hypothetical protein
MLPKHENHSGTKCLFDAWKTGSLDVAFHYEGKLAIPEVVKTKHLLLYFCGEDVGKPRSTVVHSDPAWGCIDVRAHLAAEFIPTSI